MRATSAEYLHQLQALLPPGQAWTRSPDAVLSRLLDGQAEEMARAHNRLVDLIDEADPQTTTELLEDWERVAGLPDCCIADPPDTIEARRALVVGRLAARGGQSAAYYVALCAAAGWEIEVTDFRHFIADEAEAGDMVLDGDGEEFEAGESVAGDSLGLWDWWHAWRVFGEPSQTSWFEAGESVAGDAIDWLDNPTVRCLLGRLKPHHTRIVHAWRTPDFSELFADHTVVSEFDFTAGSEAGLPLGWRLTVTYRHDAAPLISVE